MDHVSLIASELSLPATGVRAVLDLLKEGGTVPFIARYRKERTGALDEVQIRSIQERDEYLTELGERKTAILKSIEEQGKLTPELKTKIEASSSKTEIEDLYLPYKPKRVTRAAKAKERGLEPLADLLWAQGDGDLAELAKPFVNAEKEVLNTDQAWAGARDIVAERIADDAAYRGIARRITHEEGAVITQATEEKAGEKSKFDGYYDHKEPLAKIPPHRYLAIRRGEKEGYLRVTIDSPMEKILARIEKAVITRPESPLAGELKKAAGDAYARLIAPSIENELREDLKSVSDESAIEKFAVNVQNLMLASPLGAKTVLGLDPGFRTGVKVAVIDKTGKVVEHVAVYPHFGDDKKQGRKDKPEPKAARKGEKKPDAKPDAAAEAAEPNEAAAAAGEGADAPKTEATEAKPVEAAEAKPEEKPVAEEKEEKEKGPSRGEQKRHEAKLIMAALLQKHDVEAIAIGNGTAGRETEAFVDEFLKEWAEPAGKKITKVMVNESGASVYSASDIAREEFPDLDLTVRGAISIGRRLQDPLAELVKIDPRSIGVGEYQHDVNQARLRRKLGEVVESCVNRVGVDVNTASAPLLSYVAGIGPSLAKRIVKHREEKGAFRTREDLKKVTLFGDKAFEQAAGFLRVRESENPLDNSAVHPEAYPVVEKMAADLGVETKKLVGNGELAEKIPLSKYIDERIGELTLKDILEELRKPGRDPRAEFSGPAFRADITDIRHLQVGMILEGVVTNVTSFGSFVDIGVHQDGLVHVSEISHQYVKDPTEALKVGDQVKVKVLGVDEQRKRISLSIKQTQAAPPKQERGPRGPRPRGDRPQAGAGEGAPRGARPPRREGDRGPRPQGDRGPRAGGDRGPRPGGDRPQQGASAGPGGAPQGARPQQGGRPPDRGRGGDRGAPRTPKKVGTHGRTQERVREGMMGGPPERGPREQVPKQKKPDTSLGALLGDVLKNLPKG